MTNFEVVLEQLRNEYNELVKRNERQYDIIKDLESILEEMEEKLNEEIEVRPKGEWIVSKEDSNFNCSICGCNPRKDFRASSLEWIREINGCDMQYCPWCGADMRGEK